ncbi:MAG TPA: twin-arginine translocase subunit TatC, partial [Thermoanaerobaculia bacterium]
MAQAPRDFAVELLERLGLPTSYLAHLRELRQRLLRVLFTVGFFYTLFFLFEFREVARVGDLPILAPSFSPFHPAAAQVMGRMISDLAPAGVVLIQTSSVEIVILYMQIALALAVACSMPMILYQFGRFVMPALYPHERRELARLVVPGLLLFAVGCIFAYTVIVPPILNFLFEYSRELAQTSSGAVLVTVSIGQLLEFALTLVLVFGVVFEMPLVMSVLTRLGVVEARTWLHYWRHAVVAFLIVGGVITPDTSGVTQVLVALPMTTLYFSGCAMALFSARRSRRVPAAAT